MEIWGLPSPNKKDGCEDLPSVDECFGLASRECASANDFSQDSPSNAQGQAMWALNSPIQVIESQDLFQRRKQEINLVINMLHSLPRLVNHQ
jgi:hypothetical protein